MFASDLSHIFRSVKRDRRSSEWAANCIFIPLTK